MSVAASTAKVPETAGATESDEGFERAIQRWDALIEQFDAQIKKFDTESAEKLADMRAMLDHRLWRVRETYDSFMGSRQKFEAAAAACTSIERRHRKRLGVLS